MTQTDTKPNTNDTQLTQKTPYLTQTDTTLTQRKPPRVLYTVKEAHTVIFTILCQKNVTNNTPSKNTILSPCT